jgi:hypothetical protein
MGEITRPYNVLIRKPERNKPPGRSKCRFDNNTEIVLGEAGWGIWTGFIPSPLPASLP